MKFIFQHSKLDYQGHTKFANVLTQGAIGSSDNRQPVVLQLQKSTLKKNSLKLKYKTRNRKYIKLSVGNKKIGFTAKKTGQKVRAIKTYED